MKLSDVIFWLYLQVQDEGRTRVRSSLSPLTVQSALQRIIPCPCKKQYTVVILMPQLPLFKRFQSLLGSNDAKVKCWILFFFSPPFRNRISHLLLVTHENDQYPFSSLSHDTGPIQLSTCILTLTGPSYTKRYNYFLILFNMFLSKFFCCRFWLALPVSQFWLLVYGDTLEEKQDHRNGHAHIWARLSLRKMEEYGWTCNAFVLHSHRRNKERSLSESQNAMNISGVILFTLQLQALDLDTTVAEFVLCGASYLPKFSAKLEPLIYVQYLYQREVIRIIEVGKNCEW